MRRRDRATLLTFAVALLGSLMVTLALLPSGFFSPRASAQAEGARASGTRVALPTRPDSSSAVTPLASAAAAASSTYTATPAAVVIAASTIIRTPVATAPRSPDLASASLLVTPAAARVTPMTLASSPTPTVDAALSPTPPPTLTPRLPLSPVETVAMATPPVLPPAATRPAAPATGPGVPILMYHYVRVNPDARDRIGYGLSIEPELFRAQMLFLAERGFRVVSMRQIQAFMSTGKGPPEKTAVLTFDDGYRDAYTVAWPTLKELGFRATVYQITDLIDTPRYLTSAQIAELHGAGVEFGSHTLSHPDLRGLALDRLRRELASSRARLEQLTGAPVTSFCYPSGMSNAAVRAAVQSAGYDHAVTVEPGIYRFNGDRLAIPRVRVYGGMGLSQFARALGEPPPDAAKWRAFLGDRPAP